jgi:hypothetical protein
LWPGIITPFGTGTGTGIQVFTKGAMNDATSCENTSDSVDAVRSLTLALTVVLLVSPTTRPSTLSLTKNARADFAGAGPAGTANDGEVKVPVPEPVSRSTAVCAFSDPGGLPVPASNTAVELPAPAPVQPSKPEVKALRAPPG